MRSFRVSDANLGGSDGMRRARCVTEREGGRVDLRACKETEPAPQRYRGEHVLALLALGLAGAAWADAEPSPQRQKELLHVVRQECGSCHGLHLTGGLGPALTRDSLFDKPVDSMADVIFHGRPGTPMPPWRGFLNATEAQWIASQLARGLPAEAGTRR